MSKAATFRINLILTLLIMAVIFVHSAMPASMSGMESDVFVQIIAKLLHADAESISFAVRKAAHFTEYLALGIFLTRTVMAGRGTRDTLSKGRRILFAVLPWMIGTAYAVTDEIHQHFVQGRSCEVRDMCIDAAGVFCGMVLVYVFRRRKI